jgi:hypothetical protein
MTVSFILNESAFREASGNLVTVACAAFADGRTNPRLLLPFLLEQEPNWPSSGAVFAGAVALAAYFNKFRDRPKLARCQQALANVFAGCSYQDLMGCWKSKVYSLFSGVELPLPDSWHEGVKITHPLPVELQLLPVLAPLRSAWEARNVSSETGAFIPPIPPPTVFGMKSYASAEIYRSWNPGTKEIVINATIGVILKDSADNVRGAVRWHWWGHSFSGADFSLITCDQAGWFWTTMDIRPTYPTPTNGPWITRLTPEELAEHLSEIREIAPYEEEEGENE